MPQLYQDFEGIRTNIPGAYSKSEYPANLGSVVAAGNVVVVVGEALGGVPYNATGKTDEEKQNIITSAPQAMNLLQGGNGFYMTEFYLTPTKDPELNTPASCIFIRVNPATLGSATVEDVSANDIIDLESTVYGLIANQLSRKIEAGTNVGHKVTIKYKGELVQAKDDIYLEYMEIQYTGAGSASTMTITGTLLTTSCTGAPLDDLSITLTQFPRMDQLVAYINDQANYTCILKGRSQDLTSTFDAVTAQDIKTAEYVAVAKVEALIQFFNNEAGGLFTASLTASAVRTDVVNDTNFVFMTGGTEGSTTNTNWAGAFELLEKMAVNYILVASGDPAVHAMASAHCVSMSAIEGKKNRACGSGASSTVTTKADRIDAMKALNDSRFEYFITPFKRYDTVNGSILTSFEPFYGQAMIAGIRYGNGITISATFKDLNVISVDETYNDPDKKAYIEAGATLAGLNDEGGISVIHNVTTCQGSNLILGLPSMLRTCDYITLDLQAKANARMKKLKNAPTAMQIKEMENYIITNVLPGYRDRGLITNNPNTGDPAFSDVQFKLVGDRFNIGFSAIIPAPMHFIFIKQKFTVVG